MNDPIENHSKFFLKNIKIQQRHTNLNVFTIKNIHDSKAPAQIHFLLLFDLFIVKIFRFHSHRHDNPNCTFLVKFHVPIC